MGNERWIVNASPLILLWKADYLYLLPELAEVICVPETVKREIQAKDEGTPIVQALRDDTKFSIIEDRDITPDLWAWDLGCGETQVLIHAKGGSAQRAVLDDMEARRCAKAQGVTVIGTLGIIGRAKRKGIIQRARPVIHHLCEVGLYASDELVKWVLSEVGE